MKYGSRAGIRRTIAYIVVSVVSVGYLLSIIVSMYTGQNLAQGVRRSITGTPLTHKRARQLLKALSSLLS